MKFLTQIKLKLTIITLSILISQIASSHLSNKMNMKMKIQMKTKQLSDFGNFDPELESLMKGSDKEENINLNINGENILEEINFLETPILNSIKNSTNSNPSTSSLAKNQNSTNNPIVDLNQKNIDFSGWFAVSNLHFNDPAYFPVGTKSAKKDVDFSNLGENNFLINPAYKEGADPQIKNDLMFFFRFKNEFIYYANKKDTMSIIDSFKIISIRNSDLINFKVSNSDTCFEIIDRKSWTWTLCSSDIDLKKKWLCSLEKFYKQNMDTICGLTNINNEIFNSNRTNLITNSTKPIKQIFIIPKESPKCNANWNYQKNGSDWECTCSEGLNQSPINLPIPNKKITTKIKPMFLYDIIQPIAKENSIDGVLKENEPIKIFNRDGLLRILHNNLGKIILADGGVYHGEEIIFHTPAEHTINGKSFDLEVQIIHYGVSKGDIAKQVTLSFLFYVKPGVFNNFLDKIDVYNLPNEIDEFKDLNSILNIPSIFYSNIKNNPFPDNDTIPMKDFSFYQYEGSLTSPPCTERTTVIVAAEPLPISNTFVELFKEAIRKPEYFGIDGKLYNSEDKPKLNARNVQPLNGRKVSFYQSEIQGVI
jgi:carbonic anhydrase